MIINKKAHDYNANSGTIGAINELYVSSDLMARGLSVFRALSPSCKCDLIVMLANGDIKKVEVKTGHITGSKSGDIKIRHSACTLGAFDWLAIVLGNPTRSGSIYYINSNGESIFPEQNTDNVVLYVAKNS
jgi:hypothetical protein